MIKEQVTTIKNINIREFITFTANANGEKYRVIMSVCRHFLRLPFAVLNVKRPVLAFVNKANIY